MSSNGSDNNAMSRTMVGILTMAAAGGVIVAAQTEVINYWPLPVSIAPYFGGDVGFIWGVLFGGLVGGVIAWLTDDSHFGEGSY